MSTGSSAVDVKPLILIISPLPPAPPTSGAQMRFCQFLRYLNGSFTFHYLFLTKDDASQECRRTLSDAGVTWDAVAHDYRSPRSDALKALPRCVYAHRSPRLLSLVKHRIMELRPAFVQCEFVWMAQYLTHQTLPRSAPEGIRPQTILVEHDVEWLSFWRHFRRVEGAPHKTSALVEALKMVVYEKQQLARFDHIIALSDPDARRLSWLRPHRPISVIGQGVDCDHFKPAGPLAAQPAEGLVFVGNMAHFPNRDAAISFCRYCLPEIRAAIGQASFTIAGREPDREVRELATIPGVRVTGEVADMAPILQAAQVFVCPMKAGGGMRGKILEAMAAGVPVVSTRMGCEGLGVRDGEELLLAETPAEFADAVQRLILDQAFARRITENARRLAVNRFSWQRQASLMAEFYREKLAQ